MTSSLAKFVNIPLFKNLTEQQLAHLSEAAHSFTYSKNSVIITQGEHSQSMYIVLKGRLKVVVSDEEGRQTLLAFLKEGDFFGELSLLDGQPRSATVITVEETQIACLTQEGFQHFTEQYPETLMPMLSALASRLRSLDDTICSLSTLDVYGRVARILLSESKEEGGSLITPRMTHQEIAEMVGSSREMVSRIMKDLRSGGYISTNEQKQIVLEKKLPSRW